MNPVRGLAQCGIILLDKVPADLILGKIAGGAGVDGLGHARGSRVGSRLVLLLVGEAAVRSHDCIYRLLWQCGCDIEGASVVR
jgi:hypothetical protein